MSDRHFSLVLISFSFYRVTESGGRGLAIASSAFVAVSMIVSRMPAVMAACLMTLVISPCKLRDNYGASAAAGRSGEGKDNMIKLPYLMLTLSPRAVTMSPPDGTFTLLAVAGCTASVAGGLVLEGEYPSVTSRPSNLT